MIVCEYEDHDSGSKADRTRFQGMMSDTAQRRFDVLAFWAADRLTREGALETLQYPNRLSSYGVGFRSFTEPYLDSCGIFKMLSSRSLGPSQNKKALGYRSGSEQG
jgi:DNA invertase Pin-like site-specific DNA recombinase